MPLSIQREERWKVYLGVGLLALAALLLYRTFSAPAGPSPAARPAARRVETVAAPTASTAGRPAPGGSRWRRPASASGFSDPSLNLALLTKVSSLSYEGTERNIFQYQAAPPPPLPTPVKDPLADRGPQVEAGPPKPPPPPPIPLKYYGYAHKPAETKKRGFFLEGEEIFIAGEGEIVNKRYRIVKIGVNTVEAEDITTGHKQTLPLQENQ